MKKSRTERRAEWQEVMAPMRRREALLAVPGRGFRLCVCTALILVGVIGLIRGVHAFRSGTPPDEVVAISARGIPVNLTDYLALSAGFLVVGVVGLCIPTRKTAAHKGPRT